jgi:hypothetical protein
VQNVGADMFTPMSTAVNKENKMTITVFKTKMIGSNYCTYQALAKIENVENYNPAEYITNVRDSKEYWDLTYALMPQSHRLMPKGYDKYRDFLRLKKLACIEALKAIKLAFPQDKIIGENASFCYSIDEREYIQFDHAEIDLDLKIE